MGEALKSFEDGLMVMSVFIDMKKAFDTVSHEVILKKLEQLGVRGTELSWFKSYLYHHRQVTCCNSHTSDIQPLTIGVQQGSLLGVLLFQLIINDLPKVLKFSSSILYADDTTFFLVGKSLRYMKLKIQQDLNYLALWLRMNFLKLNVSKTKCMIMNKEGLFINTDIWIEGELVQCVSKFKFLGITIDAGLSFEPHYETVHEKLQKSGFIVRNLCKKIPVTCMRQLYYAYFDSHLCYGMLVWFPLLKRKQQNDLYILQKSLIRRITSSSLRSHCMPLFKKEKILTVHDSLQQQNLKLMFKLSNSLCPVPLMNLFNASCKSANGKHTVQIVKHRSHRLNCSFLCKPVLNWQSLPFKTRNIVKFSTFSKQIKDEMLSKY